MPKVGGVAVGGSRSTTSTFATSHSRQDKFSFSSHQLKCSYYR